MTLFGVLGFGYVISCVGSLLGAIKIDNDVRKKLKEDNINESSVTSSILYFLSFFPGVNFILALAYIAGGKTFFNDLIEKSYTESCDNHMYAKNVRRNAAEDFCKKINNDSADMIQSLKDKGVEVIISINDDRLDVHFDTSNLLEDEARQFNDDMKMLLQKSQDKKLDELTAAQERQRRIALNNTGEEMDTINEQTDSYSKSLSIRGNSTRKKK